MMEHSANLQIVGFGPAALGLFIAADRQNRLDELLRGGVVIHEGVASIGEWHSLNYLIDANSPARDFVNGVRPDGYFAACLDASDVRQWREDGNTAPPLGQVWGFLRSVASRVADLQNSHPTLRLHWSSRVNLVHWDGQTFLAQSASGVAVRSPQLLLACGAAQNTIEDTADSFAGSVAKVNADAVLRGSASIEIDEALERSGPIVIVGSSHSAFSVVCFLLQRYSQRIAVHGIHVRCSRPVALWWPSPEAATHLSSSDLIDAQTGEVNKFNGLRGAARRMYLSIRDGAERRVLLVRESDSDALRGHSSDRLESVALLVNATGYRANPPSITVASGHGIRLDESHGFICKDSTTGELTSGGRPIAGLFGMGIGFADRQQGTFEVGVNFFHGRSAERVLQRILG